MHHGNAGVNSVANQETKHSHGKPNATQLFSQLPRVFLCVWHSIIYQLWSISDSFVLTW